MAGLYGRDESHPYAKIVRAPERSSSITGGSGGLGLEIAQAFGASVLS